jgi:Ran GTPase-activating protein (RanGAP) involved in mRNA processing and transport
MPMTDEDGAVLCKGLRNSQHLTNLDLSGNLLGKLTCWELKMSLLLNESLQVLNIEANQIHDDGCFHIAGALIKNTKNKLHSLYMGWNLIDHVGFGAIIDYTGREHSVLRLINLRNNKISRTSTGDIISALAQGTSLTSLNLSHNRIADMSEIGIGLYINCSLLDLDLSYNCLADDAFGWFTDWGKDKRATMRNRIRSIDFRHNKLCDTATRNMAFGLARRKMNRCITRIVLEDNLIDPILVEAVQTLIDPMKPFILVKRQAKQLLKKKLAQDKAYWKERDWEALQAKRKAKMDQAVRLLNNRTEDEVELDMLVNQPFGRENLRYPFALSKFHFVSLLRADFQILCSLKDSYRQGNGSIGLTDTYWHKACVVPPRRAPQPSKGQGGRRH